MCYLNHEHATLIRLNVCRWAKKVLALQKKSRKVITA